MYFIFVTDSLGCHRPSAQHRSIWQACEWPASRRWITSGTATTKDRPDVNWPAEIQFIRRRLAFQAYDWMACLGDGRTRTVCTWREIRFSAADTHRHHSRSFMWPIVSVITVTVAVANLLPPSLCIIMPIWWSWWWWRLWYTTIIDVLKLISRTLHEATEVR